MNLIENSENYKTRFLNAGSLKVKECYRWIIRYCLKTTSIIQTKNFWNRLTVGHCIETIAVWNIFWIDWFILYWNVNYHYMKILYMHHAIT